jgi:hypothetical protein
MVLDSKQIADKIEDLRKDAPKISPIKRVWYKIVGKRTPEEKLESKLMILRQLIEVEKRAEATKPGEYAKHVMDDFYLDSVVVAKPDGSVLMANHKGAFEKAVKTSSLYEYINAEFPKTKMMVIKDDEKYNIIYKDKELLYLLETSGDISLAETRAVVKRLNKGLLKFTNGKGLKANKNAEIVKVSQ